jgi:hypothetical protein
LLCAAGSGPAQDRPRRRPEGCAPGERHAKPTARPPTGKAGEPLSDKLARTGRRDCPPNVDPEIKAPTPETATDAGDPAARQPRRRSEHAAEIERTRNNRAAAPLSGPDGRPQTPGVKPDYWCHPQKDGHPTLYFHGHS